jgi:hypothetical protein
MHIVAVVGAQARSGRYRVVSVVALLEEYRDAALVDDDLAGHAGDDISWHECLLVLVCPLLDGQGGKDRTDSTSYRHDQALAPFTSG